MGIDLPVKVDDKFSDNPTVFFFNYIKYYKSAILKSSLIFVQPYISLNSNVVGADFQTTYAMEIQTRVLNWTPEG